MNIHQEYISKLHINLATGDEVTDGKIAVAYKTYEKEVTAGLAKINQDLKPEIIDAQRTEIVGRAFDKTKADIENILSDDGEVFAVYQEMAAETLPEPSDDIAGALQLADDRTALRSMTPEERSKLLHEDSRAGGRRIYNALKSGLGLSKGVNIELAEQEFLAAAHPDLKAKLKQAEDRQAKKALALQAASYGLSKLASEVHGIDIAAILEARKNQRRAEFKNKNWSDEVKSAYINEHGLEAFKKLVSGEGGE